MENANADYSANLSDELTPRMGEGMSQVQEPAVQSAETTNKVEETTINNEEKRPEGEIKPVEGGDSKQASAVISELGESRKKVIEKFIESAKKSGAVAEELKELIASDKVLEKTIKSKFGTDYDALMRGEFDKKETQLSEEESKKQFETLKRKATLEARLEVMKEEDSRLKAKQVEVFAQANGLNLEEVESVKENADLLSEKYEFGEALNKALLLVNRDKAGNGNRFTPPTGGSEKPASGISSDNPLLKLYRTHVPERDITQVAKSLEVVSKGIKTDARGNESFSMEV